MSAPRYAGIDVSKAHLDLGMLAEPPVTRRVGNTPHGIAILVTQLVEAQPALVVLEATGAYHLPLLAALFAADLAVALVNPAQVAAFRRVGLGRTKTDRADALLLARLGQTHAADLRRASPRLPAQLALRELVRLREDLLASRTRLLGQQEAAHWSASQLGQALLAEQLRLIGAQLAHIEQAIADLLTDLPEATALLALPGVGRWTVAVVLAEVPAELWGHVKPAAAYVGVHPAVRQSGGTCHSRMSKAGPSAVRRVLYMAALVAIRHDPALRERYARFVARGKPKLVALGAIMHAILRRMMGVLKAYYRHGQAVPPARAA